MLLNAHLKLRALLMPFIESFLHDFKRHTRKLVEIISLKDKCSSELLAWWNLKRMLQIVRVAWRITVGKLWKSLIYGWSEAGFTPDGEGIFTEVRWADESCGF